MATINSPNPHAAVGAADSAVLWGQGRLALLWDVSLTRTGFRVLCLSKHKVKLEDSEKRGHGPKKKRGSKIGYVGEQLKALGYFPWRRKDLEEAITSSSNRKSCQGEELESVLNHLEGVPRKNFLKPRAEQISALHSQDFWAVRAAAERESGESLSAPCSRTHGMPGQQCWPHRMSG